MDLHLCGGRASSEAWQSSSFHDFLSWYAPDLLPGRSLRGSPVAGSPVAGSPVAGSPVAGSPVAGSPVAGSPITGDLSHGTTIVAAVHERGVVLAADRRATAGSMISKRDVDKVFRGDEFSAVAIAGTLGLGFEFTNLFQVELEHYEKMEGRPLSLLGKAHRLAALIRGNLGAAMQGLVVVPLFVGYDQDSGTGRIFSYDPTGGPSEERRFHTIGSGSVFANGALKKLYTENMSPEDAVLCCVQALYDAADDDSATGGSDVARRIYPVAATVTDEGFSRVPEAEMAGIAQQVVERRLSSPDGPVASLRD